MLAIQAGDNRRLSGHRHLDPDSFILEAQGRRWIIDSGKDSETYQIHRNHTPRADFYRVRAEGHNTLVLNPGRGPDQARTAVAPIIEFESTPDGGRAVVDLSAAYASHARRVRRTFVVHGTSRVTIADEITSDTPAEVWWFAHTPAAVDLSPDGRAARLRLDSERMAVRLEEPPGARLELRPAQPLPSSPNPQTQAKNSFEKLAVRLDGVRQARIVVHFEPRPRSP